MAIIARAASSTFSLYFGDDAPRFDVAVDAAGRIDSVLPCRPAEAVPPHAPYVTPGLVDIQVNGFAGVDFNTATLPPAMFEGALHELLACGVTRFLPTLITANEDDLVERLEALDSAIAASPLGQQMVMGYHVEGPFLSTQGGYSGCHPADAMKPASLATVERLLAGRRKPIRILTMAPEVPGVIELIPILRARGITCSIGHTAADAETIHRAVEAGATLSTHLGNGLPHQLAKNDNPLFAQLAEDGLFAGFIADGIHIPSAVLRTWLRAKTVRRSILTSDAAAAAGPHTPAGIYTIGEARIERSPDGVVRIPGSPYLAGSSVSMDQMVRNVMAWFDFGWDDVLRLCRVNPLHAIAETRTVPAIGDWADFIEWIDGEDGPQIARVHLGPWIWNDTQRPNLQHGEQEKRS